MAHLAPISLCPGPAEYARCSRRTETDIQSTRAETEHNAKRYNGQRPGAAGRGWRERDRDEGRREEEEEEEGRGGI